MAEVNDRGQLLLVGGIVLAIFFVALALLVNTAIYTDNVATRGGDSASEALDYQDGAETAIGGLLDAENEQHNSRNNITSHLREGTAEINTSLEQQYLRRGASATLVASDVDGNTTSGLLISDDKFSGWTVNASAVRNFVVEFDSTEDENHFTIYLNDTSLDVETNTTHVAVSSGDGTLCTIDVDDSVRFDVTAKRLNGEPCRFEWPELDDDSQIQFVPESGADGTYELTVNSDDETSEVESDDIATKAIYAIEGLRLRYHSTDVSYETSVRIAPGEPDV